MQLTNGNAGDNVFALLRNPSATLFPIRGMHTEELVGYSHVYTVMLEHIEDECLYTLGCTETMTPP